MKKIKIKNLSSFELPQQATPGSAGFDLRADFNYPIKFFDAKTGKLEEIHLDVRKGLDSINIYPGQRMLINTGFIFELPKGWEAQIRSRSGLAWKKGLIVEHGIGTIDSDYRGFVCILLLNVSHEIQTIRHGDRLAQVVFQRIPRVRLQNTAKISLTARNTGGFGSTGTN